MESEGGGGGGSDTEKGDDISKEKLKTQTGEYRLCQQQRMWGMKNLQLYQ